MATGALPDVSRLYSSATPALQRSVVMAGCYPGWVLPILRPVYSSTLANLVEFAQIKPACLLSTPHNNLFQRGKSSGLPYTKPIPQYVAC
jgi:hypothetical protein